MGIFPGDPRQPIRLALIDSRMNQIVELLSKLGVFENKFAENPAIDASVEGHDRRPESGGNSAVHGIAGFK